MTIKKKEQAKWRNAKKISITLIGINDKQAKEIIDKAFEKYGNKLYFAHWSKCKVLR